MTQMASANDMDAARKSYESFVTLIKYAVPPILLIVALVIWLIA